MKARWLLLALILAGALYLDWTEPKAPPVDLYIADLQEQIDILGASLECESTDGYGYPVDMSGYVK